MILEMAGARSVEGKIRGWSAERQGQKGSERGAQFTPGPLPMLIVRDLTVDFPVAVIEYCESIFSLYLISNNSS